MGRTRRRKLSLAPGKKDATAASSGGAAASSGRAEAAAASSGRLAAVSSGGAQMMDPVEGAAASDSSREMLQKKSAAAASSGGARMMNPVEGAAGSDSSGEMLQTAAATSVWSPTMDPQKGLSGSDSAALVALQANSTAQDREESDANHRTKRSHTISCATIPHDHCTEDEGNMGSGGTLQKQTPEEEADRGVSGDMLHKHLPEEADTAKGIEESDSNEIVHVKEEDTCVAKVKDLIKMMNASCIGEQISDDEFLDYHNRLPCNPSWIDLGDKLDDTAMDKLEALHALYRFRYLKHQDAEEKAQKLIAEAVPTLVNKPKFYAQYITKKIEIARIIGILPREEGSEDLR